MSDSPTPAHVNPPRQARSERTLERIVAASLELLATEGPTGLTVQKVVQKADSSVGSFYARFSGKDDLVDYLGERVWTDALERWNSAIASRDWGELDLGEIVEGAVQLLIDAQRSRSAYLKALDRASGRRRSAYQSFRAQLLVGLGDMLLSRSEQIAHVDPQLAVRLGLKALLGVVDAEFRMVEDRIPPETLVEECRGLLMSYLTGDSGAPSDEGAVDFFDVWS